MWLTYSSQQHEEQHHANMGMLIGNVMFTWRLVCLRSDHHVYKKNISCQHDTVYACSKHDMAVDVCLIQIIHTA